MINFVRTGLLLVAALAGVFCGRALHAADDATTEPRAEIVDLDAEDIPPPADPAPINVSVDDTVPPAADPLPSPTVRAQHVTIEKPEESIKTVYDSTDIEFEYIPLDAIENPYCYATWGPGLYPHRYDTGMGLGGEPGITRSGNTIVVGLGPVDANGHPIQAK